MHKSKDVKKIVRRAGLNTLDQNENFKICDYFAHVGYSSKKSNKIELFKSNSIN